MVFKIRLADLIIEINSIYDKVFHLCKDYLIKCDEMDFSVWITKEDIQYERRKSMKEKGNPSQIQYSDGYLETLAVYRKISTKLLDYHTFLMHGSVVSDGKNAFMITAKSGVGKTTRTKMWLDQIPGSYVINGDKPLIKVGQDKVIVYGSPWAGKERWQNNTSQPLKAILLLERAEEKESEVLESSVGKDLSILLEQIYLPKTGIDFIKTIQLIGALEGKVGIYRWISNLDASTIDTVYQIINK